MKVRFDNIRKSFVHVFGGSVLTESYLLKNMGFIISIVLIMFLFIGHRYKVLQRMSEIQRLEQELKDAKFESLTISSSLTEASRQGEIERRVEEARLELEVSREPVYLLKPKR